MKKRKFMGPWLMALIPLVALLVGSSILAGQIPVTDRCTLIKADDDDHSGEITDYYIEIYRGGTGTDDFPFWDGASYKWRYKTNAGVRPGHIDDDHERNIALLIPNCDRDMGVLPDPSYKVFPAGSPPYSVTHETNFGVWTDHDNVVRLPWFNDGTGKFFIKTSKILPVRQTSMQVKLDDDRIYWCKGIAGPSCNLQYVTAGFRSMMTRDGIQVCYTPDPLKAGCEIAVDCAHPGTPLPTFPVEELGLTTPTVGNTPFANISTPLSSCANVLIRTQGPNSLYSVSGGTATKVWP